MKNIILLLLFSALFQGALQAQGWFKPYYDLSPINFNSRSQKTLDNGHIIVGVSRGGGNDINVRKVDAFGQVQWNYVLSRPFSQNIRAVRQLPSDGSYIIFYDNGNMNVEFKLLKISATGQFISEQTIPSFTGFFNYKVELTSHNELLVVSGHRDTADIRSMQLVKMDLAGNILWQQIYTHAPNFYELGVDVKQTTDGNYVLAGYQADFTFPNQYTLSRTKVIKVDTSGAILWQQVHANATNTTNTPIGLLATNDGGCLVFGRKWVAGDELPMAQKIDPLGNLQWTWVSSVANDIAGCGIRDAVELSNGEFVFTGLTQYNNNYYSRVAFIKLSATGQALLERTLNAGSSGSGFTLYSNNGATAAASGFTIFGHNGSGPFLMYVDSIGAFYSNSIVGHYYNDYNNNCIQDAGEPAIANQVIIAQNTATADLLYGSSIADGSYEIEVDTGDYQVYANFISPYWSVCPDTQQVNIPVQNSRDTVNFGLQASDSCLQLDVAISAPRLRRCFASYYSINYSNIGTKVAQNAYVEVTLDPYLTYDSSSIALTQQTGNVYRFDVGTLPAFYNGNFVVYVTVDCDSTALGQVHCTEAHIFPDTVCAPIIWTGAIIQASTSCTNDSVTFRLRNVGSSMLSPQNYSIVEEHVMIRQAPFQLGGGADTVITVPSNRGTFYRIEASQENGFPPEMGDPVATANNMGCNGRSVLNNPNVLGQYYNGSISSFVAVDCQANIGAYDPNDKQAQPVGYLTNHYITNNIPLNYHIRFQNTGTDTAFTVVVVDTLDGPLDPASIQMGASSHPYTWQLRENGILVVTFNNIQLPDSGANQLASNGFFKFQIEQNPNNADGTSIENNAAIYFDFNAPIITNEVFHTIGSDFVNSIVINVNKVENPTVQVKVFPNPFEESTTIAIEGEQYEQLQVQVFSTTGQLVQQYQSSQGQQITIKRGNLPAGLYVYRLLGDEQLLSTGKLIIR